MPTLNYTPYPTIEPNVGQPSRYQTERATPEDFGSGIGQAEQQFGQRIEQAGDVAAQAALRQQELYNKVSADDMTNQWQEATNKLLYGDPNSPGDTGFYGKSGADAMHAFPGVRQQLDQQLAETRGKLANPAAQLLFDQETRRLRSFVLSDMSRHYDQEFKRYGVDTATAGYKLAGDGVSQAAAQGDKNKFDSQVAKQMRAGLDLLRAKGGTPNDDEINLTLQNVRANAVKQWTEGLGTKDPTKALQFLENNKDAITGEEYPQLVNKYKAAAGKQQALQDVLGGGSSSLNAADPDSAAQLVKSKESHGDYNVGFGRVDLSKAPLDENGFPQWEGKSFVDKDGKTKISHAAGAYQFQPGTWAKYAKPLGIHDFSAASQDVVFKAAYANEGMAPWAPYNSAIAAAIGDSKPAPIPVDQAQHDAVLASIPLDPGESPDAEVPGLDDKIKQILTTVPADQPERRMAAIKLARQMYNQRYADQQHALKQHQELLKAQDKQIEDGYIKQLFPKDGSATTLDTTQIANGPGSPELKQKMIGFFERQTKPDPLSKVSASNQAQLFSRIHADDGAPDKITSEQTINDAYSHGDLTWAARGQLIEELQRAQSPAEQNINESKKQLLHSAQGELMPKGVLGQIDLDEGESMNRYQRFVNEQIADFKKQGKNPDDLFNPKKPDYVGSREIIDRFKTSMVKRMSAGAPEATAAQTNPSHQVDLSTKEKVSEALRNNNITWDDAAAALEKLGFKRGRPNPQNEVLDKGRP